MSDKVSSNAIKRGFSILEAVSGSASGLTNSDVSRRLQIPKSSASYLLQTLEDLGYLVRDTDSGKYRLGLKLLSLTRGILVDLDVRRVAKSYLEDFVVRTKMSSHLAVLDNGRAVYVEKVEAEGFVKMDIWVGHRVPIHSTAIGKVLISQMPEAQIARVLDERGMDKQTVQTIATHTRFLREIEKVQKSGFAVDNEENSYGVRCVAAPILNANGEIVAAFGTSTTTTNLTDEKLPNVIALVQKSALAISEKMGFQPIRPPKTMTT